jgi:hypothetical protein
MDLPAEKRGSATAHQHTNTEKFGVFCCAGSQVNPFHACPTKRRRRLFYSSHINMAQSSANIIRRSLGNPGDAMEEAQDVNIEPIHIPVNVATPLGFRWGIGQNVLIYSRRRGPDDTEESVRISFSHLFHIDHFSVAFQSRLSCLETKSHHIMRLDYFRKLSDAHTDVPAISGFCFVAPGRCGHHGAQISHNVS